ncbi:MAG: response regulator [Spirochaetia bacterium]|jgi:CheY-like chemotaxis protein|nr:response regulator [Spirochaetia bacterium]
MPTVMIVDDEELIRSLIRKSLLRLGYKVIEAENGKKAMQLVETEDIDLIIADLVMPEKGGLELIMELNNNYPNIRKIVISGKLPVNNESISGLAEDFDVKAVFSKPFEIFDLLKVVKSLIPVTNPE